MTRQLVIDCATEACSVALFDDARLIAGDWRMLGRGHAESLVPMIAALPDKGKADRILVNSGPGSFTGIRVGLAAARALGIAWDAHVAGYSCLSLVAAIARADNPDKAIDVVMSGGHGEWFFQPFAVDGAALTEPVSLAPAAAVAASQAGIIAGSQAVAAAAGRTDSAVRALPSWPDARRINLLNADALLAEPAPRYGRAPDARLPQS